MAAIDECIIHPVVLCSIIDAYEKRFFENQRNIGSLLGTISKNVVTITNSFPLLINEVEDEVQNDFEYEKSMRESHKKLNHLESVVGWYSTSEVDNTNSFSIHEFYQQVCSNPLLLVLNTDLRVNPNLNVKAYLSVSLMKPEKKVGIVFTPIPIKVLAYQTEKVALDYAYKSMKYCDAPGQLQLHSNDSQQFEATIEDVSAKLELLLTFVKKVTVGSEHGDGAKQSGYNALRLKEVGKKILQLINTIPIINPSSWQNFIRTSTDNMMMANYLCKILLTQITIQNHINRI